MTIFIYMKRILLIIFGSCVVLLTACSNSGSSSTANQFSLAISSADPFVSRYVAQTGETATHTYNVTVTNNGPVSLQPGTFSISTNALTAPFSVTQNNCTNVTRGETCTIAVTYAPQSSSDLFNYQTLTFTSASGLSQTVSLAGVDPFVTVPLHQYAPTRTGVYLSDGGSQPFMAALDTGSSLLVIEQANLGPDAQNTGQQATVQYANSSITGTIYLANVWLNNNSNLSTASPAPILVVPNGSLSGFSETAVFGVKMDNQVSAKNFLAYPYNQMMTIDRLDNALTVGTLSATVINSFTTVQLDQTACVNYGLSYTASNSCWYDRGVPVTYSISGDPNAPRVIDSIFDSGAPFSIYYVKTQPAWITLNNQGYISNPMTASFNIGGQTLSIPLTSDVILNVSPDNTERFNTGYLVFGNYKILLDQADGMIGLKSSI